MLRSRNASRRNSLTITDLSFQRLPWKPGLATDAANDTCGETHWRNTCESNAGKLLPSSVQSAEGNSSTNTGGNRTPDWFIILTYDWTANWLMNCVKRSIHANNDEDVFNFFSRHVNLRTITSWLYSLKSVARGHTIFSLVRHYFS